MPRASMGVSTIRTPGGKAAGCGARTATARPGSKKAARAQGRAPCTSSCGPIHWRIEVRLDNLNAARPNGLLWIEAGTRSSIDIHCLYVCPFLRRLAPPGFGILVVDPL